MTVGEIAPHFPEGAVSIFEHSETYRAVVESDEHTQSLTYHVTYEGRAKRTPDQALQYCLAKAWEDSEEFTQLTGRDCPYNLALPL
eukprot:6436827-Amphidinium_carterae.1